ncbi:uncharacterized protein PFL1_04280 [Pseudozyma flocculosa PF-1]|uniref:Related to SET protein (Protein phosphatase 2A inhibitor) n=2 Tax=Pseudozyma flocculosa TaxID=84751 RepID=A0A5C3FF08_9BASI|nr:uncharacterized protein PFL1_04280 [Pseudozyma flocculosa PF-1]EPQ27953.1 hypothetical protein PFL1_04280 [Pseudozyma flocculosa PF-1]SPO42245.1 related to SET protein (Protein phosphatase 2A inhibitor) [Pseudozyma flocculosa]
MSEAKYIQPAPSSFDDAHKPKVEQLILDFRKADVELVKQELKIQAPLFEKRAEIVADVENFWFQSMVNCMAMNVYIDDADHEALSYLSGVRVERDLDDPRAATIVFSFRENPFFSDAELVKKFPLAEGAKTLEEQFNFVEETVPQKTEINWKSDDKNLCKLKPTVGGRDSDDFEPGSFFSTFFANTDTEVAGGIGHTIMVDWFPNALDFYLGEDTFDDEDFDSEEDEEDEDDEDAEIDLEAEEERPKKKTKAN